MAKAQSRKKPTVLCSVGVCEGAYRLRHPKRGTNPMDVINSMNPHQMWATLVDLMHFEYVVRRVLAERGLAVDMKRPNKEGVAKWQAIGAVTTRGAKGRREAAAAWHRVREDFQRRRSSRRAKKAR